ncbi:pyruvate kinase [Parvularcula sp. ZS-1/3]|uniref:Pyruvate kinase n=1 Tax=Parvularcula mediterranea TaxID=2732508 RepID=A0A7Y3RLZ2_9PROT|nr:pyruvate kinase [Parvularcula mediterranea]NNU16001.1 pyruvate kinase [Parvularcula mediterranea]
MVNPQFAKTKILATLGPASSSPHRIEAMIRAGASAFRMNFSHGSHEEHAERFRMVRDAAEAVGRPVAIVSDMQGPKLRVGKIAGGEIQLSYNEDYEVTLGETAAEGAIPIPHQELFDALQPGDAVMMNDGALRFTVKEGGSSRMVFTCDVPGKLTNNKGVNIPGRKLPLAALTEKDKEDLAFAISQNTDYVALSFVQTADDLREARELMGDSPAKLIAKIEKPGAMDTLGGIVSEADALMVARGDLGVELPLEMVPRAQRRIIRMARNAGKPVIVATQMLESMIDSPTPTRAEASDTAAAAYLGADCVMLSAETAVGRHPEAAIAIMSRILKAVADDDGSINEIAAAADPRPPSTDAEVIAASGAWAADKAGADAILAATMSGGTAYAVARNRPGVPVVAITPNARSARQLALIWGVYPVKVAEDKSFEELSDKAAEVARERLQLSDDGRIVLIAGVPKGIKGGTNTLKLIKVGG